jgi:hypothetical protein
MHGALANLETVVVIVENLLLVAGKPNRIDGTSAELDIMAAQLGVVHVLLVTGRDLIWIRSVGKPDG